MLRIGSRGSKLALWQAQFVKNQLSITGVESEIIVVKTTGDLTSLSFDKIEGKGFFTKEIEEALLNNQIDVAVHSMKDLPTDATEGLIVAGVSERASPGDVLLIHKQAYLEGLLPNLRPESKIGTSSARRIALIADLWPTMKIESLRGNVNTRIEKLRNGEYDAIILAKAGIERISPNLDDLYILDLHPREFIPAPAQGVLAYQCRKDDEMTKQLVRKIHVSKTVETTNIERSVLKMLEGGCQKPIGVYCQMDNMLNFHVWACNAPSIGAALKRVKVSLGTSKGLVEEVCKQLSDEG